MNVRVIGFIAIAVAAFAVQAQAHHSFAMFDHENNIGLRSSAMGAHCSRLPIQTVLTS